MEIDLVVLVELTSLLLEYDEEETPEGSVGYTITVKGLNGGHSGMDIHKDWVMLIKL
jgi:di/tripeptidase